MGSMTIEYRNLEGTGASVGRSGRHTVIADRPEGKAFGTGLGFNGGELLALSLGGCFCNDVHYSEAIAVLENASVDVVLTDVVMPGMNGIELADTIKNRWSHVPVVLATGYSDELVGKRPEYQCVMKPFTSAHLQEALASALRV